MSRTTHRRTALAAALLVAAPLAATAHPVSASADDTVTSSAYVLDPGHVVDDAALVREINATAPSHPNGVHIALVVTNDASVSGKDATFRNTLRDWIASQHPVFDPNGTITDGTVVLAIDPALHQAAALKAPKGVPWSDDTMQRPVASMVQVMKSSGKVADALATGSRTILQASAPSHGQGHAGTTANTQHKSHAGAVLAWIVGGLVLLGAIAALAVRNGRKRAAAATASPTSTPHPSFRDDTDLDGLDEAYAAPSVARTRAGRGFVGGGGGRTVVNNTYVNGYGGGYGGYGPGYGYGYGDPYMQGMVEGEILADMQNDRAERRHEDSSYTPAPSQASDQATPASYSDTSYDAGGASGGWDTSSSSSDDPDRFTGGFDSGSSGGFDTSSSFDSSSFSSGSDGSSGGW